MQLLVVTIKTIKNFLLEFYAYTSIAFIEFYNLHCKYFYRQALAENQVSHSSKDNRNV